MCNYVDRSLPHPLFVRSHLPLIYTCMKPGRYNKYVLLLIIVSDLQAVLCKGLVIWNAIRTGIQQEHSLRPFALSL